MLLVLSHSSV